MLFVLNITREAGYSVKIESIANDLQKLMPKIKAISHFERLGDLGLVQFTDRHDKPVHIISLEGNVGLSFFGMAFLINNANGHIEQINNLYGDLPENLIATLVPYLDLSAVPAADRHVRTTDNLDAFKSLENELKIIRLEIQKDMNLNELPIPNKSQALADIDSILAQINDGFVRLSDLTSRMKPLVKSIADWCKDFAVIAGAASAAWLAIDHILKRLF